MQGKTIKILGIRRLRLWSGRGVLFMPGRSRVHVDHDVFDLGKAPLHRAVDHFRDLMALGQGQVFIRQELPNILVWSRSTPRTPACSSAQSRSAFSVSLSQE